jgi:nicotinate-nucleotide adenylyltransferase
LPQLADFVVVPRDGADAERFMQAVRQNWPQAAPCPPDSAIPPAALPDARSFALPEGARLLYLPLARLDISASLIRSRFTAGLDLRFLIPPACLEGLEAERALVEACWK